MIPKRRTNIIITREWSLRRECIVSSITGTHANALIYIIDIICYWLVSIVESYLTILKKSHWKIHFVIRTTAICRLPPKSHRASIFSNIDIITSTVCCIEISPKWSNLRTIRCICYISWCDITALSIIKTDTTIWTYLDCISCSIRDP